MRRSLKLSSPGGIGGGVHGWGRPAIAMRGLKTEGRAFARRGRVLTVAAVALVCALSTSLATASAASADLLDTLATPLLATSLALPSNAAATPVLATDKPDYSPGETVHVTGTGFGPDTAYCG